MKTQKWLLPVLALAFAGAALAQPEPARFYKLDYVVKEVEGGKVVNSRAFSTMLALQTPGRDTPSASIRAGGRVPVVSGTNTQFYELGVNIDSRDLRDLQGDLSVSVNADISTIGQENATANIPVVRQNRWSGTVMVAPKKSTVIFASDDLSSKRQLQLELTATPIK